jgi:hypothetical protein
MLNCWRNYNDSYMDIHIDDVLDLPLVEYDLGKKPEAKVVR